MQGVMRGQCAVGSFGRDGNGMGAGKAWETGDRGGKGEKRGRDVLAQVMLPVQVTLLALPWEQEPGSGMWQNCSVNDIWSVKGEQKLVRWKFHEGSRPGLRQGTGQWDQAIKLSL